MGPSTRLAPLRPVAPGVCRRTVSAAARQVALPGAVSAAALVLRVLRGGGVARARRGRRAAPPLARLAAGRYPRRGAARPLSGGPAARSLRPQVARARALAASN